MNALDLIPLNFRDKDVHQTAHLLKLKWYIYKNSNENFLLQSYKRTTTVRFEGDEDKNLQLSTRYNSRDNYLSALSHVKYIELLKNLTDIEKQENLIVLTNDTLRHHVLNEYNIEVIALSGDGNGLLIPKTDAEKSKYTWVNLIYNAEISESESKKTTRAELFAYALKDILCGETVSTISGGYIFEHLSWYIYYNNFNEAQVYHTEIGALKTEEYFYREFRRNDGETDQDIKDAIFYHPIDSQHIITKGGSAKYSNFTCYLFISKGKSYDESLTKVKDLLNLKEGSEGPTLERIKEQLNKEVYGICFFKICNGEHPLFGVHCMLEIICSKKGKGLGNMVKVINDILLMSKSRHNNIKIILNVVSDTDKNDSDAIVANNFYLKLGFKPIFHAYSYMRVKSVNATVDYHKANFTKNNIKKKMYNTMVLDLSDDESRMRLEASLAVMQSTNGKLNEIYFKI